MKAQIAAAATATMTPKIDVTYDARPRVRAALMARDPPADSLRRANTTTLHAHTHSPGQLSLPSVRGG